MSVMYTSIRYKMSKHPIIIPELQTVAKEAYSSYTADMYSRYAGMHSLSCILCAVKCMAGITGVCLDTSTHVELLCRAKESGMSRNYVKVHGT